MNNVRANLHRRTVNARNAVNSLEYKKRNLQYAQGNAGRIRKYLLGRQIRKINAMLPVARAKHAQLNRAGMNAHRRARGY
jgi:hypothetical protein